MLQEPVAVGEFLEIYDMLPLILEFCCGVPTTSYLTLYVFSVGTPASFLQEAKIEINSKEQMIFFIFN
jgi:hypothetical protein